jgi:hypothetical protein
MAELDYKQLNLNIRNFKVIKTAALEIAESKLSDSKKNLLQDFSSHPVTVEIEAGENSQNSSGTLGGYGNLFSFIGFISGSKPTEVVKNLINKIRLIRKSYVKPEKNGVLIKFNVFFPKKSDFEDATPIPWAAGRSWLSGIERGISGLGYFISRGGIGRSGGGEQADNKIRSSSFKNVSYFSKMYSDFFKKLTNNK